MSRLEKRLLRLLAQASRDYQLIEPHDHILVGVSGGKDSLSMLHLLRQIQRRTPFPFSLVAITLDQGQPGFDTQDLARHLARAGYDHRVIQEHTFAVVQAKTKPGQSWCPLCSRLRRGILYSAAVRMGANKIALGHHRDDFVETLLLNLLFSGQTKAMAPRLRSDDGRNCVIRPLMYCREAELAAFAQERAFPIVGCGACAAQASPQRQQVKRLIATLAADNRHVAGNLFAALHTVRPTHLLDRKLRELAGSDGSAGAAARPGRRA